MLQEKNVLGIKVTRNWQKFRKENPWLMCLRAYSPWQLIYNNILNPGKVYFIMFMATFKVYLNKNAPKALPYQLDFYFLNTASHYYHMACT